MQAHNIQHSNGGLTFVSLPQPEHFPRSRLVQVNMDSLMNTGGAGISHYRTPYFPLQEEELLMRRSGVQMASLGAGERVFIEATPGFYRGAAPSFHRPANPPPNMLTYEEGPSPSVFYSRSGVPGANNFGSRLPPSRPTGLRPESNMFLKQQKMTNVKNNGMLVSRKSPDGAMKSNMLNVHNGRTSRPKEKLNGSRNPMPPKWQTGRLTQQKTKVGSRTPSFPIPNSVKSMMLGNFGDDPNQSFEIMKIDDLSKLPPKLRERIEHSVKANRRTGEDPRNYHFCLLNQIGSYLL